MLLAVWRSSYRNMAEVLEVAAREVEALEQVVVATAEPLVALPGAALRLAARVAAVQRRGPLGRCRLER